MKNHVFGLDVLENADGSARVVLEGTEIVVAVHGPAPVKAKQELTDRAALEVTIQPLSAPPCVNDTAMANRLKKLLDQIILSQLHPRTLITVVVQPVRLDGSVFATMVNACVAALLDASIPLKTSLIATSAVTLESGSLEVFPSKVQEQKAVSSYFAVFDANGKRDLVSFETSNGRISEEIKTSLMTASASVYTTLRSTVKQRLDLLKHE